jgi:hypothetical protein
MKPLACFFALALSGCSLLSTDGDERHVIDVPAVTVTVLNAESNRIAFDFVGGLPVPCFEYAGSEINRDEQRLAVRVRARSTSEVCATVNGRLFVNPLEVVVAEPGEYTFAFWRADRSPLEVTVEVP